MTTAPTPTPTVRNGVPVDKLFAAVNTITGAPELGAFRFTAANTWVSGTASRSSISEWHGVGADHAHVEEFSLTADHPTLGRGYGPTPQEFVLHALAACLTLGIATTAAARRITLRRVTSRVTAELDARGVLGIDPTVRTGFSNVHVTFDIDADADDDAVDALIEASKVRSAVLDIVSNPTPVTVARAA